MRNELIRIVMVYVTLCLIIGSFFLTVDYCEIHEREIMETNYSSELKENLSINDHTSISPIRIDDNNDFEHFDLPGSGSIEEPWMIQGYEIDAEGYGSGIYIGNVTDHFVIKNCHVYNASGDRREHFLNSGIHLYNAENGTIMGNVLEKNRGGGIWLKDSRNINVADNLLRNHTIYSIRLCNSIDNEVYNNQLLNNYRGIYLYGSSRDNKILDNYAEDNDFGISLIDSYDNDVESNLVFNNTVGIQVYGSGDNVIKDNTAERNDYGISFSDAKEENHVTGNLISHNEYGIYLSESKNQFFESNIMEENGIFITGDQVEHWSTHRIASSNSIGEKPIYYFSNTSGDTVPQNAG